MTGGPADGGQRRAGPAIVVIGLGNRYRSDDAAGLEVARRVRTLSGPRVMVVELESEPIGLLDAWVGFDRAVVVDAVGGADAGHPGEVHEFDAGSVPIPVAFRSRGTHAFGLADVIELARATGRLPHRVVVHGIAGRTFSAGEGLTPEVARGVETVAALIVHRIREQGE